MKTTMIALLIALTPGIALAAAPMTPSSDAPVAMKADDIQKAAGLAQLKAETDKTLNGVDTAQRIGIVIETGKPGPSGQGTLVVMPTDPSWSALVALIKTIGNQRAADTNSALSTMGIAVQP